MWWIQEFLPSVLFRATRKPSALMAWRAAFCLLEVRPPRAVTITPSPGGDDFDIASGKLAPQNGWIPMQE